MSHEFLAALIQRQREALEIQPGAWATHGAILGLLEALERGQMTTRQTLRILDFQAARMADDPETAALYRQVSADLKLIQHHSLLP